MDITITFDHPAVKDTLFVRTGANQFTWDYRLNTQTYPTYAGEVVQILSVFIDNITIQGDLRRYKGDAGSASMEDIYRWFAMYFQVATQGFGGKRYDERPVEMKYPARGWHIKIRPLQLPGLRYGRDVVVPTWEMQAQVLEADPRLDDFTTQAAQISPHLQQLSADIGYRPFSPFSDAHGVITEAEKKQYGDTANLAVAKNLHDAELGKGHGGTPDLDAKAASDAFDQVVKAYQNGDFTKSILSFLQGGQHASKPTKAATKGKNSAAQAVGNAVASALSSQAAPTQTQQGISPNTSHWGNVPNGLGGSGDVLPPPGGFSTGAGT